jgi:hypothetical protein
MRRIFYLSTIALLVLTLTANAAVQPTKKQVPVEPSPTLPINTNIVYLVIVGLVIGIFVVRKSKQGEADIR